MGAWLRFVRLPLVSDASTTSSSTPALRGDILAARLKSLEGAGIVRRRLYQERPARYEYHLAEAGEQLYALLHTLRDWGDRFARHDPENIVTFRHSCGAKLQLETCCAACGEPLAPGDVTGDRDVRRSDLAGTRPIGRAGTSAEIAAVPKCLDQRAASQRAGLPKDSCSHAVRARIFPDERRCSGYAM